LSAAAENLFLLSTYLFQFCSGRIISSQNKMLSYPREIVLQGAL